MWKTNKQIKNQKHWSEKTTHIEGKIFTNCNTWRLLVFTICFFKLKNVKILIQIKSVLIQHIALVRMVINRTKQYCQNKTEHTKNTGEDVGKEETFPSLVGRIVNCATIMPISTDGSHLAEHWATTWPNCFTRMQYRELSTKILKRRFH